MCSASLSRSQRALFKCLQNIRRSGTLDEPLSYSKTHPNSDLGNLCFARLSYQDLL